MENQNPHIQIIDLDRSYLPAAVELLAAAFAADPMANYLFVSSAASPEKSLSTLFWFSCEVRFHLGWPLLGRLENGVLQGVLGVTVPEDADWPPALSDISSELGNTIGAAALARLERYAETADTFRPQAPHYHVGFVGVHPRAKGRGHGAALMRAVHAMSSAHPTATGIFLDTENPANLPFYQHLGYAIVGETVLDTITLWGMYRPNNTASPTVGSTQSE